jgi:hypothetical protein
VKSLRRFLAGGGGASAEVRLGGPGGASAGLCCKKLIKFGHIVCKLFAKSGNLAS